jgi:class 3 adenylate cyclase
VVEATQAFTEGFAELEGVELAQDDRERLEAYYQDVVGPRLAASSDFSADASTLVPSSAAARYLQVQYTIPFENFDDAIAVDDAEDGSTWSAAHAAYQAHFRTMTTRLEYEDVLLLDASGTIVYAAYKGIDLGSNVVEGPLRFTNLARAYTSAMTTNLLGEVAITDFGEYPPSLDRQAGWAVTPIGADGTIIGALAVELPIDRVSRVMTADGEWSQGGLGGTGEVYLVGADELMRSPSRVLLEDPDRFAEAATATGMASPLVETIVQRQTTVGLQPIRTEAAGQALSGQSGTIIATNYLGRETLAAYGPVEVGDLGWVVVAELDTSEAFAPVTDFTRNLVISSAVLALIVSVLSLLLARIFVRPLRALAQGAQRIAAGETGVVVDAGRSDEMISVATAFNDMSRSLQVKAELLDEQSAESERLLRALMPEPVIRRYREGDQTITEDHHDVTVLYADIVGFDEFSSTLDSPARLDLLNELVKQFDDSAAALGVEHVRTTTKGYLASCGMTVPRVDNARRIVDFALELQRILERFGAQWGAELHLRAGIDLGEASSGLVGRAHVVYDLWGEAVNLAFRIQSEHPETGIFVTERVSSRLPATVNLSDAGVVVNGHEEVRIWRVEAAASHD